ncbi:MAG: phosphoribosylamine--glycine ligase [Bacteroidales bacterium]
MNVLIIGAGGREHALAWKIAQSPLLQKLYIAPGNGGTHEAGENIPVSPSDFDELKRISLERQIDMIVVGPEQPLAEGIKDFFNKDQEVQHIFVVGPDKEGAKLESSKAFANQFMRKYSIPTAEFKSFDLEQLDEGFDYLESLEPPYVLKADGLAAGKGVIITSELTDAKKNLKELLEGKFGEASKKVVIEQYLKGKELSVFILTDGENYKLLPFAKDYKRAGEGDTGPNTGGMGSLTPVPYVDKQFQKKVENDIIYPTLKGLKQEGIEYQGFLYFGLMKVGDDPYVIEYNVRLGDPETQPVLSLLQSDLLSHLKALQTNRLNAENIAIYNGVAASVILASGGYPGAYEKGKQIYMPSKEELENVKIFHAGTKSSDHKLFTAGGRVMAVTARAGTFDNALKIIYDAIDKIEFQDKYYRKDIGYDL